MLFDWRNGKDQRGFKKKKNGERTKPTRKEIKLLNTPPSASMVIFKLHILDFSSSCITCQNVSNGITDSRTNYNFLVVKIIKFVSIYKG